MKSIPLNSLYAYWHVYAHEGIRAAARALEVSHSSVLRHVKELEMWFGSSLIETRPNSKALIFTQKGQQLGENLAKFFPPFESNLMKLKEEKHSNQVIISTTPSIASRWLMAKLPEFQKQYPNIEIHIRLDQKVESFKISEFDIAIRMGRGGWDEPYEQPLMDDCLIAVSNKQDLYQDKYDLLTASLIHDGDPEGSWHCWFENYFPEIFETVAGRKQSKSGPTYASSDLVIRAAMAGDGVALVREQLCRDELRQRILIDVFPDKHVHLKDAYWLVGAKPHHQSKATRLVWEWLLDNAS
ncbi:LysR substrate-binding domain-containing protein [Curvivirga aplysinae]|uniref:LysR substrate-binding domain-containing protein n=1 Tax=Curvivirga aplysinae TaxID=2529852 RepID=UPI0012BC10FB|nr:LysR substrate-binding domain-containing protein [Curvivirga aplysinae]MTI08257.1 LysR family transcriptional regulator [Curvivirga aplysinae]